jgi:hypothetical protein
MTKRTLFTAALLLACAAPAFAQTDPCASPVPTGIALNPSKLYATLPEHAATLADTSPAQPVVTNYVAGYFPQGQGPTGTPTFISVVPKTAFTLVPGTTSCYVSNTPTTFAVQGTVYVAYLRAHRDAFTDGAGSVHAEEDSDWSTASNPFASVRLALAAPGRPTVR